MVRSQRHEISSLVKQEMITITFLLVNHCYDYTIIQAAARMTETAKNYRVTLPAMMAGSIVLTAAASYPRRRRYRGIALSNASPRSTMTSS